MDMCVHMLAYITVWTVCMCAYSSHVLMQVYLVLITSVMIYHRGASLSEQHTDLLICHCT